MVAAKLTPFRHSSFEAVGHEVQRTNLAKLRRSNRLPSGMLFVGPAGIGKARVARELASALLCANPPRDTQILSGCGECNDCHLMISGNAPDFFVVPCGQESGLGVAAMREMLHNLQFRSFHGIARVIILEDADQLNLASGNLLLKALEEPAPNTYFILVATNQSKLLPTLRSRCQSWFFNELTPTELRQILSQAPASEKLKAIQLSLEDFIKIAEGTLSRLNNLESGSHTWLDLQKSLSKVAAGDLNEAVKLAQELAKEKDAISNYLTFLRSYGRSTLRSSKSKLEQNTWAVFLSNIIEAERLIFERNLAPIYVLTQVFIGLANSAHQFTSATINDNLLTQMVV